MLQIFPRYSNWFLMNFYAFLDYLSIALFLVAQLPYNWDVVLRLPVTPKQLFVFIFNLKCFYFIHILEGEVF